MKQSSVEWLYNNLLLNPISNEDIEYNEAVFENAKEMEKLQQGYSEEEVIDLLKALQIGYYIHNERVDIDKWFEQFKNK